MSNADHDDVVARIGCGSCMREGDTAAAVLARHEHDETDAGTVVSGEGKTVGVEILVVPGVTLIDRFAAFLSLNHKINSRS